MLFGCCPDEEAVGEDVHPKGVPPGGEVPSHSRHPGVTVPDQRHEPHEFEHGLVVVELGHAGIRLDTGRVESLARDGVEGVRVQFGKMPGQILQIGAPVGRARIRTLTEDGGRWEEHGQSGRPGQNARRSAGAPRDSTDPTRRRPDHDPLLPSSAGSRFLIQNRTIILPEPPGGVCKNFVCPWLSACSDEGDRFGPQAGPILESHRRTRVDALRGYLAMGTICVGLLLSDFVQRLVIGPWLWLRPGRRRRVLGPWLHFLEALITWPLEAIGGVSLPPRHRVVPCKPGVLIVLNHQSLLDIPLGVRTLSTGYLRLVTRRRYARSIPLISHLIRLYRNPLVDPSASTGDGRRMLKRLRRIARESDVPIMIYPEGTRTKDGEIGPFRPAGMGLVLRARPFEVHAFVVDGLWRHARFKDLMGSLREIDARMEYVGRFDWTDPKGDPEPFVARLRSRMVDRLAEMRAAHGE